METSEDSFHRLSLDDTIRKTFALYRSGWKVLTALSTLMVALDGVLWAVCLVAIVPALKIDGERYADPEYMLKHLGQFYIVIALRVVANLLVNSLFMGPMILGVVDVFLGRSPDFKTCMAEGIPRARALFAVSVMGFFAISLGLMVLIVPGYYLAVRWIFVGQVVVIEGLGAVASFRRSWQLSKGSWCYIFCTALIFYVVVIVAQFAWSNLVVGGDDINRSTLSFWGSLISALPGIVVVPVMSVLMTLMYLNMRIEKEGMNEDVLINDLGAMGVSEADYRPLEDDGDDEEPAQSPEEAEESVDEVV